MTPKFKIGDLVQYCDPGHTHTNIFRIAAICLDKDGYSYSEASNYYPWFVEDMLILCPEPKKKVTKYLWAFSTCNSSAVEISFFFYTDIDDFKKHRDLSKYAFFKRLDWSATIFEEE